MVKKNVDTGKVAQCPDEYEAVMWGRREESLAEREG